MNKARQKLMIVDDNTDNRELLEDIFEDDYDIVCAEDGMTCLELTPETKPDLILLDINMPKMDGYEVCRRLKGQPETALIPIVFVTALATTEQRLNGYEAGAEDYVTKPFVDEIIIEIVHKVLERSTQMSQFAEKNKEAMSTAYQAMASSAELGQIIQFLQASYSYKSEETLAKGLGEITRAFGLNACVNIRCGHRDGFFACEAGSIESKVFERFREGDRILDFGARSLVNGTNISLLIKNMPLDNPELYGRIKDHLIVLISGSEACVKSLEIEHQLEEGRRAGIQSVVERSHDELNKIGSMICQQDDATRQVIESLRNVHKITSGIHEVTGLTL
ncbi:MAG: CheY-like chemotaxis protein [Flavobacteriales bacterium]|jgi:CheY-like chemotaxis protein